MGDSVRITAAALSNYSGLDVLLDAEGRVCLGKRERYDNQGHYDNGDDSLLVLSHNRHIFDLLSYCPSWVLPQKAMIEMGFFRTEDFWEYECLHQRLTAAYKPYGKVTFDGQPFVAPKPGDILLRKTRYWARGRKDHSDPVR